MWKFYYEYESSRALTPSKELERHKIYTFYAGYWYAAGETEVSLELPYINFTEMYSNKSEMHPLTYEIFVEPIDLLNPLAQTGFMDEENLSLLSFNLQMNALKLRFWNNQNKLIARSMQKCNKTAWILPNYYAQDIARRLRKSEKHSDVSTKALTRPILGFRLAGLVPLSLLSEFWKIEASGIFEWWPNLINRTDIKLQIENVPPKKPNMKGHTQVIFFILGIGHSFAICCLFLESVKGIFKCFIRAIHGFCLNVRNKLIALNKTARRPWNRKPKKRVFRRVIHRNIRS